MLLLLLVIGVAILITIRRRWYPEYTRNMIKEVKMSADTRVMLKDYLKRVPPNKKIYSLCFMLEHFEGIISFE